MRPIDALQHGRELFVPDARRLRLADADHPVVRCGDKMVHKVSELSGKVLMDKENVQI